MISAVIVAYYPEIVLFEQLMCSVIHQVDRVIIVDNTPEPFEKIDSFIARYFGVLLYLHLGKNAGIASAQNIGIRRSLELGCTHVMFLDQDSTPAPDMVKKLISEEEHLIRAGNRVAAVGPLFVENKTGEPSHAIKHGFLKVNRIRINPACNEAQESDYIIASGALVRISVLNQIGLMLEDLFIDWVDVEWGLRAKWNGYRSFIIPHAVLNHNLGDRVIRIYGRNVALHSDIRHYYLVRNAVYLLRVKTMGCRWRVLTFLKIPLYVLFYSWHSEHPIRSVQILMRALTDGILGNLGPLN